MITIVLRSDGEIEAMHDMEEVPHIVIVNEKEKWTDSPSLFIGDADQAEEIAAYRNAGFEDRNP